MGNTELNDEKPIVKHNANNGRIIYFDILNILACLCVIFLHMNGIVHQYIEMRAWKTALIFEVACYWAVPVFIMLSGATLLKYKEKYDTKTFFKKRFVKILIPWIVWSLISYIIKNQNINLFQFIKDFMYCKIEYVYWFIPLTLYLYCVIPILTVFTEKEEYRKILKAIVLFIFVFRAIIYPICVMFDKPFPAILDYFLNNNGYIMFLILGYLLSTTKLSKGSRIIIYIMGIASAIFRYVYTYYFSIKEGTLNRDLFDYCSAFSVLLAMAVFVFVKKINWEKIIDKLHIKAQTLSKISSCSFGIYLIHILIMTQLTDKLKLNVYSIGYRTVGAALLYIICLGLVYLIKKIPILKKIVP